MSVNQGSTSTLVQIACVVVILAGLKAASTIVVPLLLAMFIAIVAYTPIQWLIRHKIPLWAALLLVLFAALIAVFGLGGLILQSAVELQAQQDFYVERLSLLFADLNSWLRQLGVDLPKDQDLWASFVNPEQLWTLGLSTLSGIGSTLSQGFLILLVFIFIIAESSSLPAKIQQSFRNKGYDATWLNDFATNLNHYIAIKTLFSLITGLVITVSLWLLGVDFPILWGMLAFMLNYIPNIGSIIAATPAVLLALIQLGVGYACATAAIYVVVNQVIGAAIEPRFLGKRLDMSTLTVFLSLILWGWMFGAIGMLLSVPLTMSIKLATEGHESTAWIGDFLSREVEPIEKIDDEQSA